MSVYEMIVIWKRTRLLHQSDMSEYVWEIYWENNKSSL